MPMKNIDSCLNNDFSVQIAENKIFVLLKQLKNDLNLDKSSKIVYI